MGKTFRRDSAHKPRGKDFKKFKKSNKLKKWNEAHHQPHHVEKDLDKDPIIEEFVE